MKNLRFILMFYGTLLSMGTGSTLMGMHNAKRCNAVKKITQTIEKSFGPRIIFLGILQDHNFMQRIKGYNTLDRIRTVRVKVLDFLLDIHNRAQPDIENNISLRAISHATPKITLKALQAIESFDTYMASQDKT